MGSISLSSVHVYTTERDPNKSPPIRSNHLPISSQTSPSSSSPVKRISSSNQVVLHTEKAVEDDEEEENKENQDMRDNDDDEFAGLEMIGNTQWEREVPNFQNSSMRKSKISSSEEVNDEINMWTKEDDLEELDESDWEVPLSLLQDQKENEKGKDLQVAIHSPIAGPSSPPLRTPAFSLPSLNSDIPSGPYPQTPQTHDRQFVNSRRSSPIPWSPSPCSSRGKRNEKSKNQSLIILSDDSDNENGNDHINKILKDYPTFNFENNENNEETSSPDLPLSKTTKGKGKGKGKRIIESDLEEDDEIEEPLAMRKRRKQKGKEKESSPSIAGRLNDIDMDVGFDPTKEGLDDLFREDEANDENYDPGVEEAEANQRHNQEEEEEEDFDFDEFNDFPFDEVDLEINNNKSKNNGNIRMTRSRTKSISKSPQKTKTGSRDLANDLFPSDEDEAEKENLHRNRNYNSNSISNYQNKLSASKANYNYEDEDEITIIEKIDSCTPTVPKNDWDIPLISDLEMKWQEFFNNHWRRGVDKSKAKEKAQSTSKNKQRESMIGGIYSEDEDDDEEDDYRSRTVKKTTTSRGGPAKRGGSAWGWRGRGRGAWRGRASTRGKAKSRKK
ncbi:uncharacterized protein L201_002021 [Kwoniella dendrophila CBS 6074]|uniref:Btz domain-containing protein n=1 Tax=Kwoniella dendrophila CBS 6074 TaxID=1295534 RepID=A0AAX4JRF4_9TREE